MMKFTLSTTAVWGLFMWDIIITILETIAAWHSFASAWGDVSSLEALYWPFAALPALTALGLSFLKRHRKTSHCYFFSRIRRSFLFCMEDMEVEEMADYNRANLDCRSASVYLNHHAHHTADFCRPIWNCRLCRYKCLSSYIYSAHLAIHVSSSRCTSWLTCPKSIQRTFTLLSVRSLSADLKLSDRQHLDLAGRQCPLRRDYHRCHDSHCTHPPLRV